MNVSVVDLSASQKKLQVEIPAQRVQGELEKKYRDLAKNVKIKGFRPGKVPRSILKSYYGKAVEGEISSQFVKETFSEALREADLTPLVEAELGEMHFEDNGTFKYEAVVDVCPPFQMEGYTGLEITKKPIRIDDQRFQAELERMRQQHAQLRTVEPQRPVQMNDNVLVDFIPSVDGQVFEKGRTTDFLLEVGKRQLHPDFDELFVGHEPGDVFACELDYPEAGSPPELAGKRVHFEVTVKEVKEKILPELSDEFAQELGRFDTLEELKQDVETRLQKQEEETARIEARNQIIDQLIAKVDFELSAKVVEKEIDRHVEYLKHQFESQGLKMDGFQFNAPGIRDEYRLMAERNVRWRLICTQIAKQEGLELSEEEVEEIYSDMARMTRMDVATLKKEYADSGIIDNAKEGRIQEKVVSLLEREASYKEEASADETPESQE